MSTGDRRERPEKILKDAEPALDQPPENEKSVGVGDVEGQGNQVVVGNDNIVITDTRHCTKTHSLRRATRLLWMIAVGQCVPLIFCVEGTRPSDPTIICSITTITAQNEPDLQTGDLADTTTPLAGRKSQTTRGCPELLTSKIPGKLKSAICQKPVSLEQLKQRQSSKAYKDGAPRWQTLHGFESWVASGLISSVGRAFPRRDRDCCMTAATRSSTLWPV